MPGTLSKYSQNLGKGIVYRCNEIYSEIARDATIMSAPTNKWEAHDTQEQVSEITESRLWGNPQEMIVCPPSPSP